MNILIKILRNDDGMTEVNPVWHLVDPGNDLGNATLCTGEFFGGGESSVKYEIKEATHGIECKNCRRKIRIYKAVRL